MLSQTAEYALRAVLFVAEHEAEEGSIRVGRMADALGIPANYLAKTLHALARAGVLTSGRGPTGGFRLAAPAGETTLGEVVAPFDQIEQRRQCLLGNPVCSDRHACAAHVHWKQVADKLAEFFSTTTVADLRGGRAEVLSSSSSSTTRTRSSHARNRA